jgi:hypothetical protein
MEAFKIARAFSKDIAGSSLDLASIMSLFASTSAEESYPNSRTYE